MELQQKRQQKNTNNMRFFKRMSQLWFCDLGYNYSKKSTHYGLPNYRKKNLWIGGTLIFIRIYLKSKKCMLYDSRLTRSRHITHSFIHLTFSHHYYEVISAIVRSFILKYIFFFVPSIFHLSRQSYRILCIARWSLVAKGCIK